MTLKENNTLTEVWWAGKQLLFVSLRVGNVLTGFWWAGKGDIIAGDKQAIVVAYES